jgi:hypothetical protein
VVFPSAARAAKAVSARDSWANPTIALITTTPKMTAASIRSPSAAEAAAETSRT